MAATPYVEPNWEEVTFEKEGLDARALITKTDIKGIITFASLAYRKMTKFDKDELIGSPHSIVRHPFMPETVFKEMWKIIKNGISYRGIIMNLRKDGRHYWVEVRISPIGENGEIICYAPEKIRGYLAVRREPSRKDIQKSYEKYIVIRKAELLQKFSLKKWEEELLSKLDALPKYAEDLII